MYEEPDRCMVRINKEEEGEEESGGEKEQEMLTS